jgi:hypothetical protein
MPGGWQKSCRPERLEELLDTFDWQERREKKLNLVSMVYWLLALHLYPHLSQRRVYSKLTSTLRCVREDVAEQLPSKAAFSYRREQLGAEPLHELFRAHARPMATKDVPGAFWKGLRLMALDGTRESVPDTPANRTSFPYSTDDEGNRSPYPQVQVILLVECATHLICDAHFGSVREGEQRLVHVLVRTLMLRAAQAQDIAPVRLSFTETLRILDEHLAPLALAPAARRLRLFDGMVREIGQQRLPIQPLRIQARVLKRSHARYAHKKREHWHAVPFQVDLDFHEVIALVV